MIINNKNNNDSYHHCYSSITINIILQTYRSCSTTNTLKFLIKNEKKIMIATRRATRKGKDNFFSRGANANERQRNLLQRVYKEDKRPPAHYGRGVIRGCCRPSLEEEDRGGGGGRRGMMRARERKNEKKKHILEILARKKSHEGKRGP